MNWFGHTTVSYLRTENETLRQQVADLESHLAKQTEIHQRQLMGMVEQKIAIAEISDIVRRFAWVREAYNAVV